MLQNVTNRHVIVPTLPCCGAGQNWHVLKTNFNQSRPIHLNVPEADTVGGVPVRVEGGRNLLGWVPRPAEGATTHWNKPNQTSHITYTCHVCIIGNAVVVINITQLQLLTHFMP